MLKNIKLIGVLITLFLVSLAGYPYISGRHEVAVSTPTAADQLYDASLTPFIQKFSHAGDYKIQFIAHNTSISLPVSVVEIAKDEYLFCNYSNILHIGKNTSTATVLSYENYSGKWVPTGLWLHAGVLYVANYLGNNILVFNVDKEKMKLSCIKEIRHDALISPENIYVNDAFIATANYDGGNVTVFDHAGKLIWQEKIKLAHGITGDDEYIYATSLETREIYKFDYAGTLHAKSGGLGYTAGKYAWPTAVAILRNGRLAVVDAHNGRITFLDKNFQVLGIVGVNGSGADMLHFPYAVLPQGDDLCIVDTFNGRFLILNERYQVQQTLQLKDEARVVRDGKTDGRMLLPLLFSDPYTYDIKADCIESLFQNLMQNKDEIYSSYGAFNILDSKKYIKKHIRFTLPESRLFSGYFYVVLAHTIKYGDIELIVIHSPENRAFLFIDPSNFAFAVYLMRLNVWDIDHELFRKDSLVFDIFNKFKKFRSVLGTHNSPFEAWNQIFMGPDCLINDISSLLGVSKAGKQFKLDMATGASLKDLRQTYLELISRENVVYLFEYLAVNFLAENSVTMTSR